MPDPLGDAVDWVRRGGLLAYPTETVWGLAAGAASADAVAHLRTWKGREAERPLSILVEGAADLPGLGFAPERAVERLTARFWPGPLTLVAPRPGAAKPRLAPGVARPDGAVGVRCSAHPLAAALARRLRAAGVGPVTATSLNRSGEPAAPDRPAAEAVCGAVAEPDALRAGPRLLAVEGAEAGGDAASTVVDVTGSEPRVLRWGAVGREALEPVLREIARP